MKPSRRRPIKSAALLLLLLGLSLGGFGLLSVVFPEWVRGGGTDGDRPYQADKAHRPHEEKDGIHGSDSTREGMADRPGEDGRYYDPKALPKGLTSIDGEGGTGMNRAVKKNGVWFPVYSPGPHPGSGPPPLTVIPLSIASGTPPPGRVNETFLYQAEAIGGVPPYRWSAVMDPLQETFTFGTDDGILTGLSQAPLTIRLELAVTDAAGARDSAQFRLAIKPEKELVIDTAAVPVLTVGEPVDFAFQASGGVPPYHWLTAPLLVNGMTIYRAGTNAGSIEGGPPMEAKEETMVAILTDSQGTRVEKSFTITVTDGLRILTPSALPPAAPGQAYHGAFEAEGGTPPYRWTLEFGRLPDPSWKLSEDGVLTGFGGVGPVFSKFTLMVSDAADRTFEKTFTLAVSDLLTLVPSREKAGVAWHPGAVSHLLAQGATTAIGFRVLRDGRTVYEGTDTNFVDRGLTSGAVPRYTLLALTTDGEAQPIAEKETAILPWTWQRAQPGVTGDPYADRVVSFQPLSAGGYGASGMPRNVTGPPDGRSTWSPAYKPGEVASLHASPGAGGSIELEFTDNIVEIAPGEDLTVFENVLFVGGNGNQRFMEPAIISVALFPGEWHRLPCDVVPPAAGQPLDLKDPFYYARGFAGRNGTTGSDPTNPKASGGDSLDLDDMAARAGLSWIRYIKIQSTGDGVLRDDAGGDPIRHPDDPAFNPLSGSGSSGFDLDAVSAVNY